MRPILWSVLLSLVVMPQLASSSGPWIYLSSFQSGKLVVYDAATGAIVQTVTVEDRSGSIGATVTADGKRLFVVDGDDKHRVRSLDPATGKDLQRLAVEDRTLQLGRGGVSHLTADERWLLIHTYDYGAAAAGVRILDLKTWTFVPLGLRDRACASPNIASARDGSIVTVCARVVQPLKPLGTRGEFLPGQPLSIPIADIAAVALSRDGRRLFVVEPVREGSPWRLAQWTTSEPRVREHDLIALLKLAGDRPTPGNVWIDVSPDGAQLALLNGRRLWLLDGETLSVARRTELPWAAQHVQFAPDGREVLTLRSYAGADVVGDAVLLRASTSTGETSTVPLKGLKLPGATVFQVAPAAR